MSSPRSHRLRSLFQAVLGATSGVTLLAGCGPSFDADDFDTNECRTDPLEGVTPTTAVDYLELRQVSAFTSTDDPPTAIAARGTACANATAPEICKSRLADLHPKDVRMSGYDFQTGRFLVFTRGDEVGAISTVDALGPFLAPFENPHDGFLLISQFTDHYIPCDGSNVRAAGDAFEFRTQTGGTCGENTHLDAHIVRVSREGEMSIIESDRLEDGDENCVIGRRPEGFSTKVKPTTLGDYFANAAELEAASVPAFRRLARELRAHGAPTELVDRAKAAALDEVRHARGVRALARRFGATAKSPRVGKLGVRSLVDIAMENAREGCVRETFGALVATFQARRATDVEIATAMGAIADDETEHAALAWDVAAWIDTQLDAEEKSAVLGARSEAYAEVVHASGRPSCTDPRLGLPTPAESLVLLAELGGALYGSSVDPLGIAA